MAQTSEDLNKLIKQESTLNLILKERKSLTKDLEKIEYRYNKSKSLWYDKDFPKIFNKIKSEYDLTKHATEINLILIKLFSAEVKYYDDKIKHAEKVTKEFNKLLKSISKLESSISIQKIELSNITDKNSEEYKSKKSLLDSSNRKLKSLLEQEKQKGGENSAALKYMPMYKEKVAKAELKLYFAQLKGKMLENLDVMSESSNLEKAFNSKNPFKKLARIETHEDKYNKEKLRLVNEIANAKNPLWAKHFYDELADLNKKEDNRNKTVTDIENIAKSINAKLSQAVAEAMTTISTYMGTMNTRLQGIDGKNFDSLVKTVSNAYSTNGLLSQKALIENINKLVEKGISYNLEERALLATISDRVVTNFDVTNDNLLRLIRIEQADLTQSQIGVQSKILLLLNSTFGDSAYLSDLYTNISEAISEANSQLNYEATAGFDYAIQKWLGALYEAGMDKSRVSSIATGLNALATGNVQELTNNQGLMTLFGMSASNAGLNLASLLTNRVSDNDINKLMSSMVKYLLSIAANTETNQVTRSAYANILNMSVSDLRAVQNLTDTSIKAITESTMNYATSLEETNYLLSQVASRTSIQTKMDNILDNVMYTWGMNIANSPLNYLTYKGGEMISKVGSGLVGTTGKVMQTAGTAMQLASGVSSLFSLLGSIGSSLSTGGLNNIAMFNWDLTMSRGGSANTGISYSTAIKSANNLLTSASLANNAVEAAAVEMPEAEVIKDANDLYDAIITNHTPIYVHIDSFSDNAKKDLTSEDLKVIRDRLINGTVNVDIIDNDINSITGILNLMRLY